MSSRSSSSEKVKAKPASRGPIAEICRFLGSLPLTVALLLIFGVVLAAATFLESERGAAVSQWYVYHGRWFIGLLAMMGVNILAAMLVRLPWKGRHVGFLVAHAGILVLMAGSMLSFRWGVEGRLTLVEGEKADEIVLRDSTLLTATWHGGGRGRALEVLDFPFEPGPTDWPDGETRDLGELEGIRAKVLHYYRHAVIQQTKFQPVEDTSGESQAPPAIHFEVTVDGKPHEIWLSRGGQPRGFNRIETSTKGPIIFTLENAKLPLGFSVRLIKFIQGKNPGGMGDASYSSEVQLEDESEGLMLKRTISMNNPLTHGKFTIYQSDFTKTTGGRNVSILTVSYDPGRFMKYLGSLMVCAGTFVMFYWKRRSSRKTRSAAAPQGAAKATAVVAVLLAIGVPAWGAEWSDSAVNWDQWRRLPVQDGGRQKPLDTLAREAARQIVDRATFTDPETRARLEPAAAYLAMLFEWQGWDPPSGPHAMRVSPTYFLTHKADKWDRAPLLPVDGVELRKALGMAEDRKHISASKLGEAKIRDPDNGNLVPFDGWVQELYRDKGWKDFTEFEKKAAELANQRLLLQAHRMGRRLMVIPIKDDVDKGWLSMAELMRSGYNDETDSNGRLRKVQQQFGEARAAYVAKSPEDFNKASAALIATLRDLGPELGEYPQQDRMDLEVTYNQWAPFHYAWIFTAIASLALLLSLGTQNKVFYVSGLAALIAGLAAMLVGMGMRWVIKEYPPVTNLYESVVFTGFGTVLFGLVLGLRRQRQGVLAAAAVVATIILLLADYCPSALDPSLRPLPPVLRSSFWLAIHVKTIMLSYAAFALAVGIGNVTLGFYLVGASTKKETIRILSRTTFELLQAGVLLLLVGTILGAAWADDSWGRFWGWDPKEVWALITLVGYLAIVHARYAGWVGNRGMAAWSVTCFTLVLMAWYGVNFLSGGLHNYGLGGEEGPIYVAGAIGLQLLYVTAAILRSAGRSASFSTQ